jgi:hypothetical protein
MMPRAPIGQPDRLSGRRGSTGAGPYWAWVGAHGGAGVTTLADAVPGGIDLGRALPWEAALPTLPIVAVCRGNAKGLSSARDLAATASCHSVLLGLVVVADMPERRRPKALADSLYLTGGAYGDHVWEMPWVTAWRLGEPSTTANNPPAVRDLLRSLWTAVNLPLPGAANSQTKHQQRSKS